jgi:hypothetical protein
MKFFDKWKHKHSLHDFDLDLPVCAESNLFQKNEKGEITPIMVEGVRCKRCGKILWIRPSMVKAGLPLSMGGGCPEENKMVPGKE